MSGPRERRPVSPERCGALSAVTEQRPDGTRRLVMADELDMNGARSLEALAVEQCIGDLDVDGGAVGVCDARGLGALVTLNNQLCQQGRRLRVTGANAQLARLLDITDLENLLR